MVANEVPRDNPPKFIQFDITKTCKYHLGVKGYSTDNSLMLKIKVQSLLNKGTLSFNDAVLNAQQNPLPDYTEGVNMAETNAVKQAFIVDIPKPHEIRLARRYEKGNDILREEKMVCI